MNDTPNHRFAESARRPCLSERALGGVLRCLPVRHGKHLVLSHLDRVVRLGRKGWVRVPWAGGSVVVDGGDLVGRHFMMLRDFDPHVCDALAAAARPGTPQVLWDIGANQGTCSYQMLQRAADLRCVAIEPQVELHALLSYNLTELSPDRFESHCVGIGCRDEQLTLMIEAGNRGHASLCETDIARSTNEVVSVVTPEAVLERSRFGPPDLIKIDVEGYESVVMEALAQPLAQWPTRAVVFESHLEGRPKFLGIVKRLEQAGFDLYRITKHLRQTALYPLRDNSQPATDFVALRRGLEDTDALRGMMHASRG